MWDLIVSDPDHCLSFYFPHADWPVSSLRETKMLKCFALV